MKSVRITVRPENLSLDMTPPRGQELKMGQVLASLKAALPDWQITAVAGPISLVAKLSAVRDYRPPEKSYKLNIGPFKDKYIGDVNPTELNDWMFANWRQVDPIEKAVIDSYLGVKLKNKETLS